MERIDTVLQWGGIRDWAEINSCLLLNLEQGSPSSRCALRHTRHCSHRGSPLPELVCWVLWLLPSSLAVCFCLSPASPFSWKMPASPPPLMLCSATNSPYLLFLQTINSSSLWSREAILIWYKRSLVCPRIKLEDRLPKWMGGGSFYREKKIWLGFTWLKYILRDLSHFGY